MILVVEQVSPNIALTPENYLLCSAVNISRIGTLVYGEGEIPCKAEGGMIIVERDEDEVFSPESIASFELKPITVTHPSEMVDSNNWKDYSVGVVQNVRRDGDFLVCDMLIQDQDAIDEIQKNGLRAISIGYDAEYVQTIPGRAKQRNIIGNHISLVEKGRAGSRCFIKDHQPNNINTKQLQKDNKMSKTTKNWVQKLFTAVQTNDEALLQDALEDRGDGGDLHIHLAPESEKKEEPTTITPETDTEDDGDQPKDEVEDRLAALEAVTAKLITMLEEITNKQEPEAEIKDAPNDEPDADVPQTTDEDEPVEDEPVEDESVKDEVEDEVEDEDEDKKEDYTKDSLQTVLRKASILAPTFEHSKLTMDSTPKENIAKCQRQALHMALISKDTKSVVETMLNGRTVKSLKGATLDATFNGAVALMKQKNNGKTQLLLNNSTSAYKFQEGKELQNTFDTFWTKK